MSCATLLQRILLGLPLLLPLIACEQVVNRGPVAGASLSVVALRGGVVLHTGMTSTPASVIASKGEVAWGATADAVRLRELGRSALPITRAVNDDAWYVIVANGGSDFDIDGDGIIESDTGTPVQGQLHAIVRGADLGSTAIAVSSLTEAAYQFVLEYGDEFSDQQIGTTLDDFAADVVGDTNGSGVVDYRDLLLSNRLFTTDASLPEQREAVAALSAVIANGEGRAQKRAIALLLSSRPVPRPRAESIYAAEVHQAVVVGKGCESCHLPGGLGARASNNEVLPSVDPDYVRFNTENFRLLVQDFGVQGILDIAQGINHGGGRWISTSDPEYGIF